MIKNKEYYIEEILSEFDFENVHKVMTFLNWSWFSSNGVPTIKHMKDCAKKLLSDLYDSSDDTEYIGTGGFVARRIYGGLSLSFVLEEWECENERVEKIKNFLDEN